ncbi:hypothetical protein KQI72_09355 [Eubacterium sp. MSJ-21]|nr:hypothetical protein [Eubacterium sp. MSJ-21]
MSRKRHTGLVILIILEVIILAVVVILGIWKKLNPQKDTRTINTTEATTEEAVTEETATTTEAQTPEEPELSQAIRDRIANLTLEEKVSLMFVVSPEKLTGEEKVTIAGDVTRNCLSQFHVGGISYSHSNYGDDQQMNELLTNTKTMAVEIMNYMPVMFARDDTSADILCATTQNVDGLCTVLRTDDGVRTAESGAQVQVIPRYSGGGTALADTGIVMFETVSDADNNFLCMSAEDIQTYRNENNYYGIIMTGRLDDAAIAGQYTSAEAAIAAIKAGVDMVYEPADFAEAYNAVVAAADAGELSMEAIDKSAGRVLAYMESIGNLTGNGNE